MLPPDQLGDLIKMYDRDSKALKEQITDIAVYMEGGIDWNTLWGVSFEDREFLIKAINRKMRAQNPKAKEYM